MKIPVPKQKYLGWCALGMLGWHWTFPFLAWPGHITLSIALAIDALAIAYSMYVIAYGVYTISGLGVRLR